MSENYTPVKATEIPWSTTGTEGYLNASEVLALIDKHPEERIVRVVFKQKEVATVTLERGGIQRTYGMFSVEGRLVPNRNHTQRVEIETKDLR